MLNGCNSSHDYPNYVAEIWTGSDHGPLRLGFLAAIPMWAWVCNTKGHLSTFGEVGANINALTIIPHHLLHLVGDTSGLHIGY